MYKENSKEHRYENVLQNMNRLVKLIYSIWSAGRLD